MEKFIAEQLKENFVVKVFGEPYSVLKLDLAKENSPSLKQFGEGPWLVKVVGLKTAGACIKLDKPKFLLLPGSGEKADDCGFDNSSVLMWKVEKDFSTLDLQINPISIGEIVNDSEKGLSLSLKLKEPNYSKGVFTGKVEIKAGIFGLKITENVPIKGTITEGGSIKVYEEYIGPFLVVIVLTLETLNRACAEVTVYYSGFSANDKVCVTF
ncbi:hypothetical protein [Flavobacterium aquidurense]|uniref:Uncharacterized protein n=1 Tax=Flavobacterium aquidurense TaxID=362413 RepID=A0A0Q0SB68_9FLAO|nr:hypothetical protein [Flavobacterium aquidurense]KQB41287.1 hypothetical protein RC62_4664 [Flavobacterium aquidurense]